VMLEHTRRFGPAASASTPTRSSASCWGARMGAMESVEHSA
jgi:hypothetical protein